MSETHIEVASALDCKIGGEPISPSNVDILTYGNFLDEFTELIQGDNKKSILGDSKITAEKGSLKFVAFVLPAVAAHYYSDLDVLNSTGDLDAISPRRAKILETWQNRVKVNPDLTYSVPLAGDTDQIIRISKDNFYSRKGSSLWTQAEKYIIGKVVDIGGKNSPNIHVVSDEGMFKINATENQLRGADYLYHNKGFNVSAKENFLTGELSEIQLIEVINVSKTVDKHKMENLWQLGKEAWSDVLRPGDWVDEYRGHKTS